MQKYFSKLTYIYISIACCRHIHGCDVLFCKQPMSGGGGGAKWSVLRDDFMMTARTKDWRHTSLSEGEDNPYVDES